MNMADLIMEYDSISSFAKEILQTQVEFSRILADLDTMVGTTNDKWRGKAQVEFATAYSNLRPKLETISNVLKNYADAMSVAVANEKSLESAQGKRLSNMGIPSL
jgi:WXG100 family type VII secretion target